MVESKIDGEFVWSGVPAINKYLKNIFLSGELEESSVVSKMEITADDGKKYLTNYYSLDAMVSVVV